MWARNYQAANHSACLALNYSTFSRTFLVKINTLNTIANKAYQINTDTSDCWLIYHWIALLFLIIFLDQQWSLFLFLSSVCLTQKDTLAISAHHLLLLKLHWPRWWHYLPNSIDLCALLPFYSNKICPLLPSPLHLHRNESNYRTYASSFFT